jgi:putative SOS response-associated peptidase YedK
MCGRFAVGDPDPEAWAAWLGAPLPEERPAPSWNVAPTQPAMILARRRDGTPRIGVARWGLVPHWWRKPLSEMKAATFNARSEEAHEKPMFRTAWERRRCLVPALGYYEWRTEAGVKQPFFVTLETNAPGIAFAGLWSRAEIEGGTVVSFTILTCPAGAATRDIHPRQPVILPESDWDRWLTPGAEAHDLMRPPPDARVRLWRVDRAVGNTRNDGPALAEPADAAP